LANLVVKKGDEQVIECQKAGKAFLYRPGGLFQYCDSTEQNYRGSKQKQGLSISICEWLWPEQPAEFGRKIKKNL